MTAFGYGVALLQLYVVPFIFAIALIYLIYGVIQYFLIGPSEEPVREEGRQSFIKAFIWCLGGALLYALIAGVISLQNSFSNLSGEGVRERVEDSVDGDIGPGRRYSDERVQPVPNVPRQNY